MKYLSRISQFLLKEQPKPMGRWNLEYCKKKINQKIDLSNEDHCGPCGQYAIKKLEEKKETIQIPKSPSKPPILISQGSDISNYLK